LAVHQEIEWATVDDLHLDAKNPRLGKKFIESNPAPEEILARLAAWNLEEVALSFLESGFWIQEALMVVREAEQLIVAEGNRRLAAIKLLKRAYEGDPGVRPRFVAMAAEFPRPEQLFNHIPYILADTRQDISAYLGYRHVTGIKEWKPAEKAEFIAHLIDDEGLTYDQVRRRIGSRAPTVRQNYITFKILRQAGEVGDDVDVDKLEERFGVLYRSLNNTGVQKYLRVDLHAEPGQAEAPVPAEAIGNLQNFSRWVFGTEDAGPLFTDSRDIDKFAALLENEKAREYLETHPKPSMRVAVELGADDSENLIELLTDASNSIRVALGTVHRHRSDEQVKAAAQTTVADACALARQFPEIVAQAKADLG
jgi:hypothetical protein